MICKSCTELSRKALNVFNKKEVIAILAAQVAMSRTLHDKVGEDKAICSSIMTKMLLCLDPDQREPMMDYMKQVSGIQIKLDHCQHSLNLV